MIVVDSSVWIDYFRRTDTVDTAWLERQLTSERLAITDLILCEILQGFRSDAGFQQALFAMSRCVVLSAGGEALVIASAQLLPSSLQRHYDSLNH